MRILFSFRESETETMEDIISKSKDWISESNYDYKLEVDEKENKLIFKAKDEVSFYINFPDQDGKLTAWSDSEDVLSNFNEVQELCDSNKAKSITDLLNVAHKAVEKVLAKDDSIDEGCDDDEDIADYYEGEDLDVQMDTEPVRPDSDEDEEAQNFFDGGGSPAAMQRLLKGYLAVVIVMDHDKLDIIDGAPSHLKSMQKESAQFGIHGSPRGDNLFTWDVKLTGFPEDSKLGQDLKNFASKYKREPVIYLEMQFPGDYPMSPPFVRVTRPRFKFLTGHVTIGGSICMEMLTKSGWRPTNDIESILVQIRSEIMSDPNARLDGNPDREYGEQEARDAFHRMVSRYNWNK